MSPHSLEEPPPDTNLPAALRRRFLSPRGLLWPAVIVVVALLLSRMERPPEPAPEPPQTAAPLKFHSAQLSAAPAPRGQPADSGTRPSPAKSTK